MSGPVEWRAGGPLRMMAARGSRASTSRRLSGLAIPFNSETVIGDFIEVVRPGSVDLRRNTSVALLWSHDQSVILARAPKTMALTEGPRGISFAADLPAWASGFVETIQRQDVAGMSFGFSVLEDVWSMDAEHNMPRREIVRLELFEVSAVGWPAYASTSVSVSRAAAPRAASVAPRGMTLTTARAELAAARSRAARAEAAAIQARAAHTRLARHRNREIDAHARLRLAAVS